MRFTKWGVVGDSGGVNGTCIWAWIGVSVGSDRSGHGEGLGRHGAWIGMGVLLVMIGDDGVQTDFGFSFDAAPTIDIVLYFRR